MSRGFVKEDDLEHAGTDLPERPISALPNYVTAHGYWLLQQSAKKLDAERILLLGKDDHISKQKLANIDRDLRYFSARLENAILVDQSQQNNDSVLFGATVEVEDDDGNAHTFYIVGEDEANAAENKVSWASPLAKALIGHKVGENVVWMRPAGDLHLEIISIKNC